MSIQAVPVIRPDYTKSVEEWWATHPFNPAYAGSSAYTSIAGQPNTVSSFSTATEWEVVPTTVFPTVTSYHQVADGGSTSTLIDNNPDINFNDSGNFPGIVGTTITLAGPAPYYVPVWSTTVQSVSPDGHTLHFATQASGFAAGTPYFLGTLRSETVWDLQAAINAAPDGTTFTCTNTTHPYSRAYIIGRNHLQFIGNAAGGTIFRGLNLFGASYAAQYGVIVGMVQDNVDGARALLQTPPGDIYWNHIDFNANGWKPGFKHDNIDWGNLFIHAYADLLFDNCTFENMEDRFQGEIGHIIGTAGFYNCWTRDSTFIGGQGDGEQGAKPTVATYYDGPRACGHLRPNVYGKYNQNHFHSQVNFDIQYDENGDGITDEAEDRVAKYCVLSGGNITSGTAGIAQGNYIFATVGRHNLCENTVIHSDATQFAALFAATITGTTDRHYYDNVVRNCTVQNGPTLLSGVLLVDNASFPSTPSTPENTDYKAINNSCGSGVVRLVFEIGFPANGTRTIYGNSGTNSTLVADATTGVTSRVDLATSTSLCAAPAAKPDGTLCVIVGDDGGDACASATQASQGATNQAIFLPSINRVFAWTENWALNPVAYYTQVQPADPLNSGVHAEVGNPPPALPNTPSSNQVLEMSSESFAWTTQDWLRPDLNQDFDIWWTARAIAGGLGNPLPVNAQTAYSGSPGPQDTGYEAHFVFQGLTFGMSLNNAPYFGVQYGSHTGVVHITSGAGGGGDNAVAAYDSWTWTAFHIHYYAASGWWLGEWSNAAGSGRQRNLGPNASGHMWLFIESDSVGEVQGGNNTWPDVEYGSYTYIGGADFTFSTEPVSRVGQPKPRVQAISVSTGPAGPSLVDSASVATATAVVVTSTPIALFDGAGGRSFGSGAFGSGAFGGGGASTAHVSELLGLAKPLSDSISATASMAVRVTVPATEVLTASDRLLGVGPTTIPLSDTATTSAFVTGAATSALAAGVGLTDVATASAGPPLGDTAAAAEILATSIAVGLGDGVVGGQALAVQAAVTPSLVDGGATISVTTTAATSALTDAPSLSDAISPATPIATTDTASATEGLVPAAAQATADGAAVSQTVAPTAPSAIADTGSVTDALIAQPGVELDLVAMSEAMAIIVNVSESDVLIAAEADQTATVMPLVDASSLSDAITSVTQLAAVSLGDNSSVVEAITPANPRTMVQASGLTDASSIAAALAIIDSAAESPVLTIVASALNVGLADSGVVVEAPLFVFLFLDIADAVSWNDAMLSHSLLAGGVPGRVWLAQSVVQRANVANAVIQRANVVNTLG